MIAALAVFALATSAPTTSPAADVAEIARLETAWNEGHLRGDASLLEPLWAEEMTVTVPGMAVIRREDAVAILRSGRMRFDRYQTSDVDTHVYGEAAVVTGRLQRTRTVGGRTFDDDWRFQKTYVRRAGRWQVVAFQASPAPAVKGADPMTTSDSAEITRAVAAFIEAYNAGDAERLIAYYADDLVKVRAGAAPETKAEVAQRIRDVMAKYEGHLDVHNEEVEVSGDMAFTRGTLSIRLVPRDGSGAVQTLDRRYLEIWRKRSGRWLVVRTMDNAP